ncbi:MAG: alpha/beta hydrolase [Thermoguttaceae bacterium]|jgi:acetyl esterase/lipase
MKRILTSLLTIVVIVLNNQFCLSRAIAEESDFKKQTYTFKKINQHEIRADVYTTDTANKRPVVVFFHGGGFIFGNREIGLQSALRDRLLKDKCIIVSADYRLAPETKIEQIFKDAEDVYNWTIKEGPQLFNADADKIIAMGTSAGGQLALHLGLKSPRPKAVVLISSSGDYSSLNWETGDVSILKSAPEYSVVGESEISFGDRNKRLTLYLFLRDNKLFMYEVFGFDVSKESKRFKDFLPINNLDAGYPPTLILHAKTDADVPYSQAEILNAAMSKMKIKHELYTAKEGHSSQLIRNNPDAVQRIGSFITEQLNAPDN